MNGKESSPAFGHGKDQPSPESKKAGWAKRKLAIGIAKALMERGFVGEAGGKLKAAAARYLDLPEEEVTVELMLHFRQIEKAIKKSDTQAYNAFMNRAYGLPKQKMEHSGEDGGPIQTSNVAMTREEARKIAADLEQEV